MMNINLKNQTHTKIFRPVSIKKQKNESPGNRTPTYRLEGDNPNH